MSYLGIAQNYVQRLVRLKSLTAALIKQKLGDTAGYQVSRMVYTNFHEAITLKHAVVVKGWPLSKFCCPSHVTSCTDIELLYNAWQSGTARFVKLDDDEYTAWQNEHLQRHAAAQVSTPSITPQGTNVACGSDDVAMAPEAEAQQANTPPTPVASSAGPPPADPAAPLAPSFVNFGANGTIVARKTRKPRKDKGVARGPRKGKEN